MKYGTICDRGAKLAVLHRVPQAEWVTVCGVDLSAFLPSTWSERARWGLEPKKDQKRIRCKKCYPKYKR